MSTPTLTRQGNTTAKGQIAKTNELLQEVADLDSDSEAYAQQVWRELKARWANKTCTFEFVSSKIGEMIEAKKTAHKIETSVSRPVVPSGRYAIGPADHTKFYRVVNKGGRYTLFAYASDTQHLVSNWSTVLLVLRTIENEDLKAAAVRFGTELEHCYRCGRALTDPTSRELGIGPDCRSK